MAQPSRARVPYRSKAEDRSLVAAALVISARTRLRSHRSSSAAAFEGGCSAKIRHVHRTSPKPLCPVLPSDLRLCEGRGLQFTGHYLRGHTGQTDQCHHAACFIIGTCMHRSTWEQHRRQPDAHSASVGNTRRKRLLCEIFGVSGHAMT